MDDRDHANSTFEMGRISTPSDASASSKSSPPPNDNCKSVITDSKNDDSAQPDEIEKFTVYDVDEERAVVRKLDRRLVLFVAALYLLSFLDRSSK